MGESDFGDQFSFQGNLKTIPLESEPYNVRAFHVRTTLRFFVCTFKQQKNTWELFMALGTFIKHIYERD